MLIIYTDGACFGNPGPMGSGVESVVGTDINKNFYLSIDYVRTMPTKKLTKKDILRIIELHNEEIRFYGVKKIGLFGSYLKGKQKKGSDIDILVEFENPTFDNYMELKFFLEKLFGRKVDLVIEESLKPALNYVKKEAVYAKAV